MNKAQIIKQYALERMQSNEAGVDLIADGWRFVFNSRLTRAIGRCCYGERLIEFGTHFVESITEYDWKDTVNHEIAHAVIGPGHGHGPKWQRAARLLGATPKATSMLENQPKPKLAVIFKNKDGVFEYASGKNRRTSLRGKYLRGRKDETLNKLQLVSYAEWEMIDRQQKLDGPVINVEMTKPVAPKAAPKAPSSTTVKRSTQRTMMAFLKEVLTVVVDKPMTVTDIYSALEAQYTNELAAMTPEGKKVASYTKEKMRNALWSMKANQEGKGAKSLWSF